MSSNNAMIVARMGCTGSGKSLDVQRAIEKDPRLIIMDAMDEYGQQAERVASLAELVKRMRAAGTFRLRYVPDIINTPKAVLVERFEVFCAAAYGAGDVTMVVEELQMFTSASEAPPAWANCTLRGRHRGLRVFGLSQRPAHVDKNFFSNATYVITGRVNFADDVSCMARVLGVGNDEVLALRAGLDPASGWKHTDFIAREMSTGAITRGIVPVPGQEGRQAPSSAPAADASPPPRSAAEARPETLDTRVPGRRRDRRSASTARRPGAARPRASK